MVNAEHLVFRQHTAHGFVDGAVGRQIVPQRLLKYHTGFRAIQARSRDLFADGGKQARRRSHVHHHRVGVACIQHLSQAHVILRLGQIHAQVKQIGRKTVKLFCIRAFRRLNRVKTRFDDGSVFFVSHRVSTHANNAPALWQAAVSKRLKQGWQQFAPCQIARTTKNNQIKTHESPIAKCLFVTKKQRN